MDFPDISQYPQEQRDAIDEAKQSGSSSFKIDKYLIHALREGGSFTVTAHSGGTEIGKCWLSDKHYGISVDPKFRRKGIGKILYTTKIGLDGILAQEWSCKYSRTLFLIKAGYLPTHWFRWSSNAKLFPISKEDKKIIYKGLRFYSSDCSEGQREGDAAINLSGDRAFLHFKYNPELAVQWLREISRGKLDS